MEDNKLIKQNDTVIKVIKIIFVFIILILLFGLGIFVGETKARFSCRWFDNYPKNFAGPREGFVNNWQKLPFPPGDIIEAHGTFGKIIKINGGDFVIEGKDKVERIIKVNENIVIRSFRNMSDSLKLSDLKVGDYVVIVGSANEEGQIEAQFIRIINSL
ncbi:MAG: hypothetical protein WC306_00610 [Candidatus Paceibacterota bacterium]|jgi:hypothetical protein